MTCVVAAACSSSSGAYELRPGVVEVYAGFTATGEGCSTGQTAQCPLLDTVTISDADRDGDRIVLMRVVAVEIVQLIVSEDRGKTWRTFSIDQALVTDLASDLQDTGIHLQDGRIFLVYSQEIDAHQSLWTFREITLGTPPFVTLSAPLDIGLVRPVPFVKKRADGHLRGAGTLGSEVPFVEDINVTGLTSTITQYPCTGLACNVDLYGTADLGTTYDGYTKPGATHDVCRFHVTEAAASQVCVPGLTWFLPDYSHRTHVVMRGTEPYVAWSQDERAYAVSLGLDGTVSEVLPLGVGQIENFYISRLGRSRYADFEVIETLDFTLTSRLVRLSDSGPEEVHIPFTPCSTDTCGYLGGPQTTLGQTHWIMPTGDGDYFVFYTVQTESKSDKNQQTLYMSREQATFTPIVADGPLPGPRDPSLQPPANAAAMTPLQVACVAYASCVGAQENSKYEACVAHFSAMTSTNFYGLIDARTRFTMAQGCAALQVAWPEGFGISSTCGAICLETSGGCTPGVTSCSTIVSTDQLLCNTCDPDDLGYRTCLDGNVYRTNCNNPYSCADGVGCVLTAGCSTAAQCLNSRAVHCDANTGLETTDDCPVRGGSCNTNTVTCQPLGSYASCNTTGLSCSGPYIKGCSLGVVTYTDCRTLGYAGCGNVAAGSRCQ